MKISVLGTGMVGRALAGRLAGLGHDVAVGTRSPEETLARTETGSMDTPPYAVWQEENPAVRLLPYSEAGAHGELVFNAASGRHSLDALTETGTAALDGKILVNVALPLDFSHGQPPTMLVANTDSLGEQIQQAFPATRVVESLNTMFCSVMVDPSTVPGRHNVFVAGNDDGAKDSVRSVLAEFGWPADSIIDLGDITGARAAEMYSRMFFNLVASLGTFGFNIQVHPGGS